MRVYSTCMAEIVDFFSQLKNHQYFSYSSIKTYVVGTHKMHLTEVLQMSTHMFVCLRFYGPVNPMG